MKKPSRAQSSLEFLTTYMWAVMLLLVMLGFLYYLGAFSGLRYSPPACYVMEGVSCTSYAIYGNSSGFIVAFSGQNNLGFDIGFPDNAVTVTAENLGLAGKNTYAGDCYSSNPASPGIVEDGRNYTCVVLIDYTERVPQPGDVKNLQIVFNYKNCGADPDYPSTKNCSTPLVASHSSAGSIYARVESLSDSSLETFFCGNGVCDTAFGETAESCPDDCLSRAYTVTLTAEPTSIPADGASTSALTATVYDQFNNPYQTTDDPVHFQILGAYGTVSPPENATNASGVSLATLTSSAVPAAITVNATCENISAYATVTAYSTILPGWVYGYVLDGSGAGIEGALVNVTNATGSPTNVTEGSGYYVVYGLDAGTYQLKASKAGYSDGMNSSVVSNGTGTETNLTLIVVIEEGWVLVPGNSEFGTSDFLVMKYEAKDVGGTAASNYSGTPWVSITQPSAQAACEAVGAHLLTINETQTINLDVASVASNWMSGTIGTGCMYGGHMQCSTAPCDMALNASSNDAEGWWDGTADAHNTSSQNCPFVKSNTWGNETRRTLHLSNGNVIWDWNGNVWEMLNDSCQQGSGAGYWYNSGAWIQWTDTNLDDFERPTLGPPVASWNSNKGVGWYMGCSADGNKFYRGGSWVDSASFSGAFSTGIDIGSGYSNSAVGFRCAKSQLGWVYGYVLDASGAGVEGALVNVTDAAGSPTNTTNESGYFAVYNLSAGSYQLRASKTGYSDGMNTSVVVAGAGTETNLMLVGAVEAGWVLVPGNPSFGTSDFLVMKYEAKDVGGVATSNYSGTPWVSVNQSSAQAACEAIGAHLVTQAEAQTINRDVAAVGANWLSGSVGSGCMYGGHMECDGVPCDSAFNASSNDAEGWWNGTSASHNSSVQNCPFTAAEDRGNETRRTMYLSNGNVLWDWSGNVWEWMNGSCLQSSWYNSGGWLQWTDANLQDYERPAMGPPDASWDYNKGVGMYYSCTANGNAFLRGGRWGSGSGAGAFTLNLGNAPSYSNINVGFRCAKSQPGWVYGYVLDGSGAGVSGALVNVTDAAGSPTNTTNGDGYFAVYNLSAGSYQLRASKTGYSDGMNTSVVVAGAGTQTNLMLVGAVEAGWVLVPGNPSFGTSDFLVMKYEAKNVGGVATSNYSGTPWVSVNQSSAQAACEAIGAHLVTQAEAQTINRDVAAVGANWLSGSVGSGCMYGGHMECDGVPCNSAFNASSNDAEGWWNGTSASHNSSVQNCPFTAAEDRGNETRRTMYLSNGNVLWDWSGNVWEWMNGSCQSGSGAGYWYNPGAYIQWSDANLDDFERGALGPSVSSWDYNKGVGMYYGCSANGNAFLHGGKWDNGYNAGAFALSLNNAPGSLGANIGFRCAKSQPGWVYGYVLDASGAGVEGALVNVTDAAGSPVNTTNGSGYFAVYGLSPGSYQLRASKTGYSDGMNTSVVVSGAGTQTNLMLVGAVEAGWVLVPGNPTYGTSDFLVMKYEAKNVGGVATSNYSGTPWVSVNQSSAQAACEAIGAHLVTQAEAQTINRDVASVASNWLSGSVGSGCMYGGHMECDGVPCNSAFNASSNDAEGWWNGTSNVHNEGVQNCPFTVAEDRGNETRRTLFLSNGQVVWDWSGNVWEYMNGSCQSGSGAGYWYSSSGAWIEWSNTNLDDYERGAMGPPDSSWDSNKGVGKYIGCTASGYMFLRSGGWSYGTGTGAFTLHMSDPPTVSSGNRGFRCAKAEPGWVYGYVLDASGAGVSGALVNVTDAAGSPTNTTNGDGYFAVYGLSPGSYQLRASKTGYSDGMNTSVVVSGAGTQTNLMLVGAVEAGWVLVPGNPTYGTSDFLVMKYEAKNVGGVATSNYSGTPWVSVNQSSAQAACAAIGGHLVTQAEAQTINRDVASVASNWLSGSVGNGCLYGGHMECDGVPCNSAFNASSNDAEGWWNGTSASHNSSVQNCPFTVAEDRGNETRRTLYLSNGQVIWDWSGNVWEYMSGSCQSGSGAGYWYSSSGAWVEWTNANLDDYERGAMGPPDSSWDSNKGVGKYIGCTASGYMFLRSGGWSYGTGTGAFTLHMNDLPSASGSNRGFRCAKGESNWVLVPGNPTYGTSDFFVMKYEAKNVSGVATSNYSGTPWVSINQSSAQAACAAIGGHLVTQAEAQTINRNVASVASNWQGGSVGSGCMYGGHMDNSPASALAASTDDDPYYGTGDTAGDSFACPFVTTTGYGKEQRRTFNLSNGQVIWDWSGNVWEYMNGSCQSGSGAGYWYSSSGAWIEWSNTNLDDYERGAMGPPDSSWNSSKGVGQYIGCTTSGYMFLRSGGWAYGAPTGAFTLHMNDPPTYSASNRGFRCASSTAPSG